MRSSPGLKMESVISPTIDPKCFCLLQDFHYLFIFLKTKKQVFKQCSLQLLIKKIKKYLSSLNIINTLYVTTKFQKKLFYFERDSKHERQIQIFGPKTKINGAIFSRMWHMIKREAEPVKASKRYKATSSLELDAPRT